MTVSRRLRFEVLRRDNHTCRYCGASAPDVQLHIDHVMPMSLGGRDEPENLITSCEDCNRGKSSVAPDQATVNDVDVMAMQFRDAMVQVSALRQAERRTISQVVDSFENSWNDWESNGKPIHLPNGWPNSIERFYTEGLSSGDLADFVRVAMAANVKPQEKFRYFSGCCWNEIQTRRELALIALRSKDTNG